MSEIMVAAGTMNDMGLMPRERPRIAFGEIIHVNRKQVFSENITPFQVLNGRAEPTIRHITRAASQPIVHFTPALSKHFEFLKGFCYVDGHAQPAFPRRMGA